MPKLKKPRLVKDEKTGKIKVKKVRLSLEIPEYIRDDFKEVVEKKGKTMTYVLTEYMKRYVRKQRELERNRQRKKQKVLKELDSIRQKHTGSK